MTVNMLIGGGFTSHIFYTLFSATLISIVLLDIKSPDFRIWLFFSIFSALYLLTVSRALTSEEENIFGYVFQLFLFGIIFIAGFSMLYQNRGLIHDTDTTYLGSHCLYFSIVTWTTLGYGDFQPSDGSRFVAAVQALIGTLFTPLYLAVIVKQITYKAHRG